MTIALYCVLAAGLMPFLWTGVAKVRGPRYNNFNVRLWQGKLEGAAQRAHAAHLNSFEAFPLFAAAVIVAQITGAEQARVDMLALGFIGLRVLYGILYLADKATLRSLVWMAALICNVMIFIAGK
ncbi:MAG TPA: MAPEG family protein [Arenimonas sp.]|nr:MAPEG family protein [Arenimonas sp.]HPO25106.1 MAPEG family protein [Arenimonas sp.]HPW33708.1 MAPEG family protein [Arenimonas sp.]